MATIKQAANECPNSTLIFPNDFNHLPQQEQTSRFGTFAFNSIHPPPDTFNDNQTLPPVRFAFRNRIEVSDFETSRDRKEQSIHFGHFASMASIRSQVHPMSHEIRDSFSPKKRSRSVTYSFDRQQFVDNQRQQHPSGTRYVR